MPGTDPPIDYREKAKAKFDALKVSYAAPISDDGKPSYWKFGNSFDTLLDFLIYIEPNDANEVAAMVHKQYAASLFSTPPKGLGGYDNAWFDDFGWWTIAANRAVQQSFFTGADREKFSQIVQNCWSRFTANAPFVWERYGEGPFSDCPPAVDHGVWNGYWIGTPDPPGKNWKGPRSGDPSNGGLEGIQNTVTNCVYVIAAQRLAVGNPQAKKAAEQEFNFLYTWFTEQPDPLWWPQPLAGKSLVRERVSHFLKKPPPGLNKPAPGFQSDWAWTGDQGLMLGALVDRMYLMGVAPKERADLLDRAKQILSGVQEDLVDGRLLRAYKNTGHVPDDDTGDYETGPGVFWRYLRHAWSLDQGLRAVINQPVYKQFLKANADIAANRPTKGQTFDDLTNDLAVLVAAFCILK